LDTRISRLTEPTPGLSEPSASTIHYEWSEQTMDRQLPAVRADFVVVRGVGTRWADNDMYGHLNNAVYYQLFDTAINTWIIQRTGVAPADSTYLAATAQNGCQFHRELFFPQQLEVGLRVARIGRSSVTYHLGLFVDDSESAAATGHWVHVYIDREKRSVVPIPQAIRDAFVEVT
jgi:acyl-CoA thioester hydrolase